MNESQIEAVPDMPRSPAGTPLDGSVFLTIESAHGMLGHPDDAPLDEFVSRCLAQLRQVMDGLQ